MGSIRWRQLDALSLIMGTGLWGSMARITPRQLPPVIPPASATRAGSPRRGRIVSLDSAFYQVWGGAGLGLFFLLKQRLYVSGSLSRIQFKEAHFVWPYTFLKNWISHQPLKIKRFQMIPRFPTSLQNQQVHQDSAQNHTQSYNSKWPIHPCVSHKELYSQE